MINNVLYIRVNVQFDNILLNIIKGQILSGISYWSCFENQFYDLV